MKESNGLPIGIGVCFFVVFWQSLDNLALGIGIGVAMAAAFHTTARKDYKDGDCEEKQEGSE